MLSHTKELDNKPYNSSVLQIGFLAAIASVLQLTESFIPMPLPGMKVGFANLVTIIAIVRFGAESGMYVAAIRSIVSSLIIGTFLSSGFVLSFSGALASAAAMGVMFNLNKRINLFSLIGISIVGAVVNNLAQVSAVYYLFAQVSLIKGLVPYLLFAAIITGYITGFLAQRICRKLRPGDGSGDLAYNELVPQIRASAPSYSIFSVVKFIAITFIFFAGLFISNLEVQLLLIAFTSIGALLLRADFTALPVSLRKAFPYLLFIFLVNLGGASDFLSGSLKGITACSKLVVLLILSFVAGKTIPEKELIYFLSKLILPLEVFGIDTKSFLSQVLYTFKAVPFYLKELKARFSFFSKGSRARKRTFKTAAAYTTAVFVNLMRRQPDVSPGR